MTDDRAAPDGARDSPAASEAASESLAPEPGAERDAARESPAASEAAKDALAPTPEPPAPEPRPDRTRRALIAGAVLLAVIGVALVGWALTHQSGPPPALAAAGPPPPSSLVAAPPGREIETAQPLGTSSPPATLRVPAIRVDSRVGQVGLNPDRTMEVPAEGSPAYDDAAWFRYSVTPGRQGPSVIIGHVDSAANGPSVFYELGRLRPGDRAQVVRADGATVTFEVTEVAVYPKDAFPTDRVYGPTPGPELRLITCGGSFDRGAGSYRDNTVVFAREVAA